MNTVNQQLAELLARQGRTQSWLARAAGLTQAHLSRLLRHQLDARASTLETLADVLGARFILVPNDKLDEISRIIGYKAPVGPDAGSAFDDLFVDVGPQSEGEADAGGDEKVPLPRTLKGGRRRSQRAPDDRRS